MELAIEGIPEDWHGYLLECAMIAKWPCLLESKIPHGDALFERVMATLKAGAKRQCKKAGIP